MSVHVPSDDQAAAGAPAARLDIVSDAICPWCYIGKRQLEAALRLLAAEGLAFAVHWNPYQLNPDMPAEGVDRAAYRAAKFGSPERAAELDARVVEAAAGVGLGFRPELIPRTPNTMDAHRLIWLAGREGRQDAMVERLFDAYFVRGADIGQLDVLRREAEAAGLDAGAVGAVLAGDEGREHVLRFDQAARQAGVDGVPSFFLNGHYLFAGAMPAPTIAEALRRAVAILSGQAGRESAAP